MNACKQSIVTYEVFVLWLHNQHHYNTHDLIGIKMTYRDLPYYEGIPKHAMNTRYRSSATSHSLAQVNLLVIITSKLTRASECDVALEQYRKLHENKHKKSLENGP